MARRFVDWTPSATGLVALVAALLFGLGCGEDNESDMQGDTEPPTVLSTVPAENGTWSPGTPILVSFSEAVTPDSVAAGILIVGEDGGILVEYDEATFTATVTVLSELEPAASYTLVVRRVEDLAGNRMSEVQQLSFTVSAD